MSLMDFGLGMARLLKVLLIVRRGLKAVLLPIKIKTLDTSWEALRCVLEIGRDCSSTGQLRSFNNPKTSEAG
jgi:hypothetical protein